LEPRILSKRALITAVTDRDGAYLADHLLPKGFEVHGIKRSSGLFRTGCIGASCNEYARNADTVRH
jgi:GDP-D-mannose dehydratase